MFAYTLTSFTFISQLNIFNGNETNALEYIRKRVSYEDPVTIDGEQ